jgi:hypothetical protein
VQCACDQFGGPEGLAERLGMSVPMVRVWLTGTLLPPPRLFFRIVDLLEEAEPDCGVLVDGSSSSKRLARKPAAS